MNIVQFFIKQMHLLKKQFCAFQHTNDVMELCKEVIFMPDVNGIGQLLNE